MTDEIDPIRHRSECTAPVVGTFIGRRGDRMAGCKTCKAFAVLGPVEVVEDEPTARPASGLVCRDHYLPVTPKGKGCPECAGRRPEKKRPATEDAAS